MINRRAIPVIQKNEATFYKINVRSENMKRNSPFGKFYNSGDAKEHLNGIYRNPRFATLGFRCHAE